MLPVKILPAQQTRWTANTRRKEVQKHVFFPLLCWFEWPDSNHAKTGTRYNSCSFGQANRVTAEFPEKTFAAHGVSLSWHRGGGMCECTIVFEEQVSFTWLKRSAAHKARIHGLAIDLALKLSKFSCRGSLLALNFAFVQRRHLPSPDCQLTDQIPELMAGWQPTQ